MNLEGKRACVVGAGLGGLALAIRLRAAGVATTLVEARDKPGGCACSWHKDGFTFDAGPTAIVDPAGLRELWDITGHAMTADVELMPVTPFCRFTWPDGTSFDYSDDAPAVRREIARLATGDLGGYEAFLEYSAEVCRESHPRPGAQPSADLASMIRTMPALLRRRAWRGAYDTAARFVENEKLRQVLSVHTLLAGGNPLTASGIPARVREPETGGGVWWARGGANRLAAGMLRHFERLGGETRLGDAVTALDTEGTRVTQVESRCGWRGQFHAVASGADMMHTYRDLLAGSARGRQMARRLARKRFGPSLFAVHLGIEGSWPGIPHHTVLFGPRYKGLLQDIFDHGVLPADLSIYLHHPTVTDPSLAPEGMSTFHALVPVPHLGKLAVDWAQVGPLLEARVLTEIERRLIPDISDRIVTRFHYTPRDLANDLGAHLGSAFGLEPTLTQSAWLRGRKRDDVISNLYLVGAGAHPGPGIAGAMAGAKATAALMLEDLAA
jgi:phytoene desaturase